MDNRLKPWSIQHDFDGSCIIRDNGQEVRGRYRDIYAMAGALCTALEALDAMRAEVERLRVELAGRL
jgi:hypothetical protein